MKQLSSWFGLGFGLAVGSGLVYAFATSEAMRLVAVGVGAFLLAALTIGGTALLVNRQWSRTLSGQSHRTVHHHRYPAYPTPPPAPPVSWESPPPDLLPPPVDGPERPAQPNPDDEIVA